MATEIEAGRQLVYRAAWLKDAGKPFALAAAQAKLYTGLLSNRVVNAALQIHGGYGFMEEFAISRLYRDQKILEIGEGTNEVQRMVIAHSSARPLSASSRLSRAGTDRAVGTPPRRGVRTAGRRGTSRCQSSPPRSRLRCSSLPGVVRLRRRGRADLAGWDRVALFAAGLGVTLFALVGPLDRLADEKLLSAHMAQHVLIGDLGPALMVTALRGPLLVFFLPAPILAPLARNARVRAVLGTLLRPRVAFALWAANLAIWHVPYLYDLALAHQCLHDFEHVCWMFCGILVWTLLVDPGLAPAADRRRPRRARGGDVRGRADPHRRARLHLHAALSVRTTARTGSRRSPTSSSPGS